jgi:hypothetical protein
VFAGSGGDVGLQLYRPGRFASGGLIVFDQFFTGAVGALSVAVLGRLAGAMTVDPLLTVGRSDQSFLAADRDQHFAAQDFLGRSLDRANPFRIIRFRFRVSHHFVEDCFVDHCCRPFVPVYLNHKRSMPY